LADLVWPQPIWTADGWAANWQANLLAAKWIKKAAKEEMAVSRHKQQQQQ